MEKRNNNTYNKQTNTLPSYYNHHNKYNGIELVKASDASYQNFRALKIAMIRIDKPSDYVPLPQTPQHYASRAIEFIIKHCVQSDPRHILKYDVRHSGDYHGCFRELDIVRFENDGTLIIGEIKTANRGSVQKGLPQLRIAKEILSTSFKKIKTVSIFVNMTNESCLFDLNSSILLNSVESVTNDGFAFGAITLSPLEVMNYALRNGLPFDKFLIEEACKEAKLSAINRCEKKRGKSLFAS